MNYFSCQKSYDAQSPKFKYPSSRGRYISWNPVFRIFKFKPLIWSIIAGFKAKEWHQNSLSLSLSLSHTHTHTHTHTHSVPAWTVWRIFLTVGLVRPVPAVVVAVASPGLQDALLVATLVLVRLAHVERSLVISRFNILVDWTRTKTKLSILFLSSFDHSDSWKSEADNLIDQNRQPET